MTGAPEPYSLASFVAYRAALWPDSRPLDHLTQRRPAPMAAADTIPLDYTLISTGKLAELRDDADTSRGMVADLDADLTAAGERLHALEAELERTREAVAVQTEAKHAARSEANVARAELRRVRDHRDEQVQRIRAGYEAQRAANAERLAAASKAAEQARLDAEDARRNAAAHAEQAAQARRERDDAVAACQSAYHSGRSVVDHEGREARKAHAEAVAEAKKYREIAKAQTARADTLQAELDDLKSAVTELAFVDVGLVQQRMIRDHRAAQEIGAAHRAVDALIEQAEADAEKIDQLARARNDATRRYKLLRETTADVTVQRHQADRLGGYVTVEHGGHTIRAQIIDEHLECGQPMIGAAANVQTVVEPCPLDM